MSPRSDGHHVTVTGPERVNRVVGAGLLVLSVAALLTVLVGVVSAAMSGPIPPPPAKDEGTLARIFQLLIVTIVPTGLFFLATSDWTRPSQIMRGLAVPSAALVLAFGILYWFEHP